MVFYLEELWTVIARHEAWYKIRDNTIVVYRQEHIASIMGYWIAYDRR
jgi:hypothetical protein